MTESTASLRLRTSRGTQVALAAGVVLALSGLTSYLTRDLLRWGGETSISYSRHFLSHLVGWAILAVGLTLIFGVRATIWRRAPPRGATRVLIEIALMAAFAGAIVLATRVLRLWLLGPPTLPPGISYGTILPMMIVRSMVIYLVAMLAVVCAQNIMRRREREQELKTRSQREELLKAQLATARLDALRAQLNPHFLFNSLHGIGGLILEQDTEAAHRALTALSRLLRHSFRHGEHALITLGEEIALIEEYLSLEQMRLGERLSYEIAVDLNLGDLKIPSLLLLPLVENAVRHGIAPRPSTGHIRVTTSFEAEHLEIVVSDDGVGFPVDGRAPTSGSGVGLTNSAERLRTVYGDQASLEILSEPGRGSRVVVRLPAVDIPAVTLADGAAT